MFSLLTLPAPQKQGHFILCLTQRLVFNFRANEIRHRKIKRSAQGHPVIFHFYYFTYHSLSYL